MVMSKIIQYPPIMRPLFNSRFWILSISIVMSVNIAGFIQFIIPPGTLQITRMEQIYGFVALFLLYIAIFASPLTKVFPRLPFSSAYLHARRAIGVSAFYYALLHVSITFFDQLGGFSGIGYFNTVYATSLIFGLICIAILFIMAITSFDWVIKKMGYKAWKLMHRSVYVATIALLIHIMLIGPHFTPTTPLGVLVYAASALILVFEILRIRIAVKSFRLKKSQI